MESSLIRKSEIAEPLGVDNDTVSINVCDVVEPRRNHSPIKTDPTLSHNPTSDLRKRIVTLTTRCLHKRLIANVHKPVKVRTAVFRAVGKTWLPIRISAE